jgi:hypothetical protein
MKRTRLIGIRYIASVVLATVFWNPSSAEAPKDVSAVPVLSAPIGPCKLEWVKRIQPELNSYIPRNNVEAQLASVRSRGPNLRADSLWLVSNTTVERGFQVEGSISNTGQEAVQGIVLRFSLGHPDSGGIAIGDDITITDLASGETHVDSIFWEGFTGSDRLYCIVDPENTISEDDETDNTASLGVTLRNGIPWVWQIVNGYCNYASLTMIFNWAGADQSVYETVEFASCPHSAIYIDDHYYLPGGIMISQSESDYDFAGEIRAMDASLEVASSWEDYLFLLRQSIDSGLPFITSVDPYYLPEEDYADLWVYGLHGGHAVVVTGYTGSSVVINDPGVGLGLINDPLPNPELRGADVVVDLQAFRHAVEMTQGTSYILVSYESTGPVPTEESMLAAALGQSISRLEGSPDSFDAGWTDYWPAGWLPAFGIAAFDTATSDMNMTTFQQAFEELMEEENGDLEAVVLTLASWLGDGLFWTQIGWEASEEYYATVEGQDAASLVEVSQDLAQQAEQAFLAVVDLVMALWNSGGNVQMAAPYLQQLQTSFDAMAEMEETALGLLQNILAVDATLPVSRDLVETGMLFCSPNPFRTSVEIRCQKPASEAGMLRIHDLAGHVVRSLTGTASGSESCAFLWDGCDGLGRSMPPSAYVLSGPEGASARLVRTNR